MVSAMKEVCRGFNTSSGQLHEVKGFTHTLDRRATVNASLLVISHTLRDFLGFPQSGQSQGKGVFFQDQGKVTKFQFWLLKPEILRKVREESGNFCDYGSLLVL